MQSRHKVARCRNVRISVVGVRHLTYCGGISTRKIEEHVKGAADKLVGKTKKVVGNATGKKLQTQGRVGLLKRAAHNAAVKYPAKKVKN